MSFIIVEGDISKMEVDAIVNAANPQLKRGGGVCGAIFKRAGVAKLEEACSRIGPIELGEAVITPGFNLLAKHIIHTAGPIYHDGKKKEEKLLGLSYLNSLELALENRLESIAFPLISSGIYGYPKEEALRVGLSAIRKFISKNDIKVYLLVFNKADFLPDQKLLGKIKHYLDQNHSSDLQSTSISEFDFKQEFSDMLKAKNRTMTDTLRKANLDPDFLVKLKEEKYQPSKLNLIALAFGLELSLDETRSFLQKAGQQLSHKDKFDLIITYFISKSKYDLLEVNTILFAYDLPQIGG